LSACAFAWQWSEEKEKHPTNAESAREINVGAPNASIPSTPITNGVEKQQVRAVVVGLLTQV
jgi:hypothetical protein